MPLHLTIIILRTINQHCLQEACTCTEAGCRNPSSRYKYDSELVKVHYLEVRMSGAMSIVWWQIFSHDSYLTTDYQRHIICSNWTKYKVKYRFMEDLLTYLISSESCVGAANCYITDLEQTNRIIDRKCDYLRLPELEANLQDWVMPVVAVVRAHSHVVVGKDIYI